MPVYNNLGTIPYREPEKTIRSLWAHLSIESVLDVGAGHGGVFDFGYLTALPQLVKKEACDIHWIRPMEGGWKTKIGVNVMELSKHYGVREFDYVSSYECLEHVENPELALEQLCYVANKIVIITSGDEMSHQGEEQAAIEKINPHQAYRRQPKVDKLLELGFEVRVDEDTRRRLIAWRYI